MGEAVQLIHEDCVFSIPDYTDPAHITRYRLMHSVEEVCAPPPFRYTCAFLPPGRTQMRQRSEGFCVDVTGCPWHT